MRITVVHGDRQVSVKVKGSSAKTLARAEAAATRLLAAGPPAESRQPFGYSVTSDHEAAAGPDDPLDQAAAVTERERPQGGTPSP